LVVSKDRLKGLFRRAGERGRLEGPSKGVVYKGRRKGGASRGAAETAPFRMAVERGRLEGSPPGAVSRGRFEGRSRGAVSDGRRKGPSRGAVETGSESTGAETGSDRTRTRPDPNFCVRRPANPRPAGLAVAPTRTRPEMTGLVARQTRDPRVLHKLKTRPDPNAPFKLLVGPSGFTAASVFP
jgi:hypothetical protein